MFDGDPSWKKFAAEFFGWMEGDHIYEVVQALFLEKDEQVPKMLADHGEGEIESKFENRWSSVNVLCVFDGKACPEIKFVLLT